MNWASMVRSRHTNTGRFLKRGRGRARESSKQVSFCREKKAGGRGESLGESEQR